MGMVIGEMKNINSQVASCVVKLTLLFLWPLQINLEILKRK